MELIAYTHDELVSAAVAWLRKKRHLYVVVAELQTTGSFEIPDAIGFNLYGHSIMVECKASRSDFRRDRKKGLLEARMGDVKYYLVPEGMVHFGEIPESWGLLYISGGKVRVASKPHGQRVPAGETAFTRKRREVKLLVQAMRRPLHEGVHVDVLKSHQEINQP